MIIKVCGMRDAQNIREVSALGINWIGFIFYHKSPRRFTLPDNGQWANNVRLAKHKAIDNYKKVGVFVNATFEQMMDAVTVYRLDYLQLHGDESPELCFALQKRGISLIKAFPVSSTEDLEETKRYEGYADYFLFDTKCENYGGSGKRFDWSILSAYNGNTPFLLSGGINPGSADAINKFSHPLFAGIDLNSGFETEPALKDTGKLKTFLSQINH